ncbi:MAG: TonB-dependent receptor [Pseudomonadales bacterium]|jgi:iron complex outermembrane receptor protein|nr:TonB-dependent receptor [Pseudomonadales bacterium]
MKNIRNRSNAWRVGSLAMAVALAGPAATLPLSAGAQEIEEVVVTGLRGKPRVATDAAVPVDVFNTETVEAVSFVETGDVLQSLVPSFQNPRSPIADGATFVRQFSLRGLPPQYTLTLVNGKRRHRAALLQPGTGNQGPDVATIPSVAIGSIEVLRDGASSQYGSDAIAGVINFNLRENTEGFEFAYDTGEQYDVGGFQQTLQTNIGFPIGDQGFISFSGEYTDVEFTEVANQYCGGTNPCIDPTRPEFATMSQQLQDIVLSQPFQDAVGNADIRGSVVQPWGQPENEAWRFFVNTGYTLDDGTELYGFGNFSRSLGDGPFNYRVPSSGAGIGSVFGAVRLADGRLWEETNNLGIGPDFPASFTPRFEGLVTDYSAVVGARGQLPSGLNWDVSGRYGFSEVAYRLSQTVNPSLGELSPTDFDVGDQRNEEFQLQADFNQDFEVDGLANPVTLAFGLSYFDEGFEIVEAQDTASFQVGPYALPDPYDFCDGSGAGATLTLAGQQANANPNIGTPIDCTNTSDPVFRTRGPGSNGFPGFSDVAAGQLGRDSIAAYVDVSSDVTDKLLLQAAARYEDYSDFGDALVGKVAGRFYITEDFAVRGSVGTGFRAPTPGQQGTTNIRTTLPFGVPVNVGLFPAGGPVAGALGASPLDSEDTFNYTLGFTANIGQLTLTVDAYWIEIEGRVNSTSPLPVSTDPADAAGFANLQALQAAGVPNAEDLGEVNFYTNAFDQTNIGVDVVATYPVEWGNGHTTDFSLAYNYNQQELEGDVSQFFAPFSQFNFENDLLESNAILTATHRYEDFTVVARARYFGEYSLAQRPDSGNPTNSPVFDTQTFDPEVYFDLEGAYQINESIRLTIGARNIFDEYPDEISLDQLATRGRIYNSGSLVPWQGGYYYGRINLSL